MRVGQKLFNRLVNVRPEIAREVRGTSLDPFYDDARVPDFLAEMSRREVFLD